MKEKYFNDTLVDVNILNRTAATPRRRQSTQLSNDETITDDVDALLSLLQDLGDERDLLLSGGLICVATGHGERLRKARLSVVLDGVHPRTGVEDENGARAVLDAAFQQRARERGDQQCENQ